MGAAMGRYLIIIGAVIIVIGLVLYYRDSVPLLRHIGRLPGDIYIKKESFSVYFPLATSIIVSIVLSIIFMLINRLR